MYGKNQTVSAKLPDKYLKEYKVPSKYRDAGIQQRARNRSLFPRYLLRSAKEYRNGNFIARIREQMNYYNIENEKEADEVNEQYNLQDDVNNLAVVPLITF